MYSEGPLCGMDEASKCYALARQVIGGSGGHPCRTIGFNESAAHDAKLLAVWPFAQSLYWSMI